MPEWKKGKQQRVLDSGKQRGAAGAQAQSIHGERQSPPERKIAPICSIAFWQQPIERPENSEQPQADPTMEREPSARAWWGP